MTTVHEDEDLDFATGAAEIKTEADKHRPVFADREIRPPFLSFTKEKPEAIIRFLDDDKRNERDMRKNLWIGVMEHSFVATVEKPESFQSDKWSGQASGMCRRARPFSAKYDSCYICDNKLPKKGKTEFASPSQRIYCRVVLRERYVWKADDPGLPSEEKIGRVKGIRDVMEETPEVDADGKPTGEKIMAPAVRLIAASQKNFFQHLIGHAQSRYDDDGEYTVLHCDWKVKRTGFGVNDTAYTITMAPGSDNIPAPEGFATEEYKTWDVNNPKILAYYEEKIPWSLRKWLAGQATDDYVDRWFVPGGWDRQEAKEKTAREAAGEDTPKDAPRPAPAAPAAPAPVAEAPAAAPAEAPAAPAEQFDDDEAVAPSGPRAKLSGMREKMAVAAPPTRERIDSSMTEDQFEDA